MKSSNTNGMYGLIRFHVSVLYFKRQPRLRLSQPFEWHWCSAIPAPRFDSMTLLVYRRVKTKKQSRNYCPRLMQWSSSAAGIQTTLENSLLVAKAPVSELFMSKTPTG